nr:MAG TPA: Repressor protein CI [Bacteriophage sp.]
MAKIAERLKNALEIRDISQSELSRKTGIGKSSISTYLTGEYEPKQKNIYKMALALNVNEAWLMGADVPMERQDTAASHIQNPIAANITPLPAMKEWQVLGATACGKPLHRELLDETILAPADIKADIVFRCVGDSMINARIFDGDAVFIHLQPEVENGQIAVVRVGDEYTLKRIYVFEDYVELRAENPTVKPIILRGPELVPDNYEVVGLAVAFLSSVL